MAISDPDYRAKKEICLSTRMLSSTPRKRLHNDENAGTPTRVPNIPRDPFCTPFQPHQPTSFTPSMPVIRSDSFVDGVTPVKKKRRVVRKHTDKELAELRRVAAESRALEQAHAKEKDNELEKKQKTLKLNQALQGIRGAGFKTLHSFLDALMNTDDPSRSSQVTQMIESHGISFLEGIRRRRPDIANDWASRLFASLSSKRAMSSRSVSVHSKDPRLQMFCTNSLWRASLQKQRPLHPQFIKSFNRSHFPATRKEIFW